MANRSSLWRFALSMTIGAVAGASADADDLSYFEKQIEPFTKKPDLSLPVPHSTRRPA